MAHLGMGTKFSLRQMATLGGGTGIWRLLNLIYNSSKSILLQILIPNWPFGTRSFFVENFAIFAHSFF